MSVDVHAVVTVERPREVVGEFMFNPKCDKIWMTGLTKVFPLTPGNLTKGAKVEHVGTFLGRYFSRIGLVVRDEQHKSLEITGEEPYPMKIRYELSDVDGGGTSVKIRIQSIGELNFPMPAGTVAKATLERIEDDLKKLKKHLEENVEE